MYLYEKVKEGDTVYFVGREIELGGKLYRHTVDLDITTSTGTWISGRFIVYSSSENELTGTEALKACSDVVGSHFTTTTYDRWVFYRYINDTTIQIPASYGGGYSTATVDNVDVMDYVEEV